MLSGAQEVVEEEWFEPGCADVPLPAVIINYGLIIGLGGGPRGRSFVY